MKTPLRILIVLLLFAFGAEAQILRPFAARYSNTSVKGNIVYVSNSIVATSGMGAGVPGTGEVSPTGTSRNNSGNGIYIDVDNPAPIIKIPFGSVWNYYGRSTAPANSPVGVDWKQSAYTMPATWNTGASPVAGAGKYGYSSGQTTCMPSGRTPICTPSAGDKYTAYYFRKTVSFTALELSTTYSSIKLDLLRNDGIVVYINGVERVRNNMPGGTITYASLASSGITPGAAEAVSVNLSNAFFTSGTNTIAVEVHLRALSSADMSFDMQVSGITDDSYNSSTADLNLDPCSNVLFAGLYWGTGEGTDVRDSSWITGETVCKLKLPGASTFTNITSSITDRYNATNTVGYIHTGYQCYANITSLVNAASPNGTYTVANVVSPLGKTNAYGGWTIVIVYGNPTEPSRNLTVFDGCAIVKAGNTPVDVGINGFLTPPTGPVSCELGAVTYDGDRAQADSFLFKQNGAATFYNLTPNATANLNDMWNSTISYKGTIVTTRNPAFNNTMGFDASIINLPNAGNAQLGNSKTSATVRIFSPSELYITQVLTTSISQYNPTFSFDKTATDINGGSLVPGDILRYQVNYDNTGNDSSTNTIIYDNIPLGSTFLPGSLKINGVTKTDAAGDDQAEYDLTNNRVVLRLGLGANGSAGGNVGPGQAGNIQFDVVTASSCNVLSCSGSLSNEARISYNGKLSGSVLYDSSGVSTSGCIIKGPVITPISGSCYNPRDTLLVVHCPVATIMLPVSAFGGYTFYAAMPFIPANMYNPSVAVTVSGIYWAYFNSGSGCSDTARIQVIITLCPDIDDDDDGIPDYVEFNNPLSLQDLNSNGTPNWNDADYPAFVDHNSDAFNDNFDWGADSDNDGIPNFQDTGFWIAWLDANNDGVHDASDKDLDGLPNQYDRDSDNDGIPDVVESYGVDTNGDGIIDNFTETDYDGFSQNVDANNTGVNSSGVGLGAPDLDGDGIANYLDLDSDNDGIPDAVEVTAPDINNDGKPDGFVDNNGNGLHDSYELVNGLLFTGVDVSPVNGRADDFPYKNKDRDLRPNAYDLDSDGDGIADVIEAALLDANYNGLADGTIGTNGWSATIVAMPVINLPNTDGSGNPDYLDIDADDDGIPDNIEGMSTAGYLLPVTTDTDGDGLVNTYDNVVGFGGSGIFVYDHDFDGTPDYRDTDTDADGLPDIVEGNDFNLNEIADDNVTLTGIDTDGDGLDNRFDSLNSVTNIKGTSYRMGNGGSFTGDPTPGSRTTVQRSSLSQTDRDWRFVGMVLPVQFLHFSGTQNNNNVLLNWAIIAEKEVERFEIERSINGINFSKATTVNGPVVLLVQQNFSATDDITNINSDIIYYRLKVIGKAGEIKYSNTISIRKNISKAEVSVLPNPANHYLVIKIHADKAGDILITLIDNAGKTILREKQKLSRGFNNVQLNQLNRYSNGLYILKIEADGNTTAKKIIIKN